MERLRRSSLRLLQGGRSFPRSDAAGQGSAELRQRDAGRELTPSERAREGAARELSDVRAVAAALARDPQLTDAERLRLGDVLARWFSDAAADDPGLQDALEAQLGGGAA
jgi:hypothetical protein